MNSRAAAARVLAQVLGEGRSLSSALPSVLNKVVAKDRGFVQNLCYSVLRDLPRLRALIKPLLKQPLKKRDSDIEALLLSGAYQLFDAKVPAHAALNECVAATRQLKKGWASGMVNGVLRNLQRQGEALPATAADKLDVQYAHPQWLIERLRKAWPDQWQAILQGNNERAPMVLRVNCSVTTREEYLLQLESAEIAAQPHPVVDSALILAEPVDVMRLPGFEEGLVSVQDAAAQLAAPLLDLQPGQRVLDACAAPGGKTGHILESEAALAEVVAIDSEGERLIRVADNLARIGLSAELIEADAAETAWWDGKPFDRILLDAPCSATGVIRRHPDIKWLRRPSDIASLVEEQQRLLEALWPLLAPGGMLVYATCSVLPVENSEQIETFLKQHDDAEEQPIASQWGLVQPYGRQILPGSDGMDGFYYASLMKR
ncbi:16S rRNA (cytosine(967)-C(5))-methyltransferase [Solemya pervernicosa gill symbiont]|uniref:16S rRNA (cytosine(967)-C(5))-methyltransferase n=2 Tax=Gammaproteobacteria incertae sedis TaxID=118884 RepID=A0A1T2L820_9GAMM|nr:16S rRNA (cytosine(967)-C(5))-methyltransferase RsmB [Candidatus Reidiella endopervernicosa]OOZ41255.1 16S rRNA (cytosine(967)-C(5))-methyltransferase [Solemya pervernicosa gill symbiont]QKQ25260.1 16S rRNA (cytosine(967)-C(5))-methyltransferase RsmB [Candidatus Reidiella endopervernicosa]